MKLPKINYTMVVSRYPFFTKRDKDLKESIQSVLNQTIKPAEVLIIDSNIENKLSKSHLYEQIKSKCNDLNVQLNIIECFEIRDNFCKKINIGVSKVRSPYVLIIDDDAELVDIDWIEKGIQYLSYKNIGLVWGSEKLKKSNLKVHIVREFSGVGLFTKKEVWECAGGYREDFLIWGNERELAIRICNLGYHILYIPEIRIKHKAKHRGNLHGGSKKYIIFKYSNVVSHYFLHYPLKIAIFCGIIYSLIIGRFSLKKGIIPSFIKGIFRFISKMPNIIRDRKVITKDQIKYYRKKRKLRRY
ncbi:MAG: glycosyltransferase family 2 protein [Promethearchaeota archaeon]